MATGVSGQSGVSAVRAVEEELEGDLINVTTQHLSMAEMIARATRRIRRFVAQYIAVVSIDILSIERFEYYQISKFGQIYRKVDKTHFTCKQVRLSRMESSRSFRSYY